MKHLIFLAACLSSAAIMNAQGPYSLENIPDSIKKNATVITHNEQMELGIESPEKAVLKVKKVFTVVNEEGRGALVFNKYTSPYTKLDEVEIRVYDKMGKLVSKHKKKDLTTVAYGEGLVTDGFITYFEIPAPSYPVTVEYNYEQVYKTTLIIPDFRFINPKEAVIQSSYTAKIPAGLNIRYKAMQTNIQPVITKEGSLTVYHWSVKNLPPVEDEAGSVDYSFRFPHVSMVVDQFSHYGYKGDFSSWKTFGNWIRELNKGMDELNPERKQFFNNLVKDATTEKEKIRLIYQFLQNNFRYVSIQLGIGGMKSFPAKFTDEKKYGDCKALSFYMKAALNSVGINSNVALINAQYNQAPVDPDFPKNGFNHMILCVPGKQDSVWLECTSNTAEFGQLGSFTENRNALLITDKGGVLVPTPKSRAESNLFLTHTVVKMDNDLSALTETRMTTSGEYSEMLSYFIKENRDDLKTLLVKYLGYKQPDDFLMTRENEKEFVLKLSLRKVPEFNAGSKFFLNPRISKISTTILPVYENRKLDFYFEHPYEKKDTTVLVLPQGFTVDVLPKEKNIKSDYASYHSSSWLNEKENAVYTATTLVLEKHKILAKDYNKVKSFFDEVIQDDAQRLVIKGTVGQPQEKRAF